MDAGSVISTVNSFFSTSKEESLVLSSEDAESDAAALLEEVFPEEHAARENASVAARSNERIFFIMYFPSITGG
jgi:hypothetical protein